MFRTDYREFCLKHKEERCEICETTEDIDVHHLDGDRSNCSLSNLVPLCHHHHMQIHHGDERYSEYVDQLDESSIIGPYEPITDERSHMAVLREISEDKEKFARRVEKWVQSSISGDLGGGIEVAVIANACNAYDEREWFVQIVDETLSETDTNLEWVDDSKQELTVAP